MSFLENEGWPSQAGYTAIAERPAAGPQPSVPHCLSLPPPLLLPLPTLSTFALVLSPLAASPAHYCPLRRRCRRHPMPPPIRQALHAGDCGHDCAHVDGAEPATCSVRFGVCNGEGAIVVLVVRFVEDRIHCVGWGPSARSEGCVSMCGHSSPVQSIPRRWPRRWPRHCSRIVWEPVGGGHAACGLNYSPPSRVFEMTKTAATAPGRSRCHLSARTKTAPNSRFPVPI